MRCAADTRSHGRQHRCTSEAGTWRWKLGLSALKIGWQKKSLATTIHWRANDSHSLPLSQDAIVSAASILRHVAHVVVDVGAHLRRRLHHRAHLLTHVG